jgi:AcrR family transcriptional regulator
VRLTRAEQQHLTHERLLEAGRLVFLERGFLTATVEEIAARAGYTRGAVYKHFGGKEGLWQAMVEARAEHMLHGLQVALERAGDRDELLAVLNPRNVADDEASRWAVVSAESLAAMAGHAQYASGVAALQKRHDAAVTELLERRCAQLGLQPAMPLRHLVVAWGALGGGLALVHTIDPGTDVAAVMAGVLAALFPSLKGTEHA